MRFATVAESLPGDGAARLVRMRGGEKTSVGYRPLQRRDEKQSADREQGGSDLDGVAIRETVKIRAIDDANSDDREEAGNDTVEVVRTFLRAASGITQRQYDEGQGIHGGGCGLAESYKTVGAYNDQDSPLIECELRPMNRHETIMLLSMHVQ